MKSVHVSVRRCIRGGFGSHFQAEALPGALPWKQNSPQHPPYGLHTELISGRAFTEPRKNNEYVWTYRIRPSVNHIGKNMKELKLPLWVTPPFEHKVPHEPLRFAPISAPKDGTDFIDGVVTMCAHGSPEADIGAAASVYECNTPMKETKRVFVNNDSQMLFLPSTGRMELRTELGSFIVEPLEMALVPRGMMFEINNLDNLPTSGYVLENYGHNLVQPEMAVAGISSGFAHTRHFLAPSPRFDDVEENVQIVRKFDGHFTVSESPYCPFDVVAWHGQYVPLKYDLRNFCPINMAAFDHADPSIGCVLTSPAGFPGVPNIDFVIFPPRWVPMENTFRPPWYHRNPMSEYMGLLHGEYDAKEGGFVKGSSSIHNKFLPHGPDGGAIKTGQAAHQRLASGIPELNWRRSYQCERISPASQKFRLLSIVPHPRARFPRYENTMAFMWESQKVWKPTEYALQNLKDKKYMECWGSVPKQFDITNSPNVPVRSSVSVTMAVDHQDGYPESNAKNLPNALIFGTGEYTTGYTPGGGSKSDKSFGVVGIVHFDLRKRGLIGEKIGFCGTNGDKFDGIRQHFEKIPYVDFPKDFVGYPAAGVRDPNAYVEALKDFQPGDICSVFTPDDSHYEIIKAALQRGLHVMATKPVVKTLAEHRELYELAEKNNVLLQIEVHKRFDPIYNDARQRVQALGEFNHFVSYMSQPKFQLDTFRAWAGISSDISYYLNSHHVDLHCWMMEGKAVPLHVTAMASNGVAQKILDRPCEDTITLKVVWQNLQTKNIGTANYTASWVAGKADVHSQQRFFCLMEQGEVTADQCHRGYTVAEDGCDFQSYNPLYIRNKPDPKGRYCGQAGYGYVSFQKFVEAAQQIRNGTKKCTDFYDDLPCGFYVLFCTAILEAGRRSLDNGGKKVEIVTKPNVHYGFPEPVDLNVV
eukprot:gene513-285_t